MWHALTQIGHWPLWNFLSVVLVVWITQRVIAWRERRKKISDTQMELYLTTIEPLSRLYKAAILGPSDVDVAEIYRESLEIMARISIFGSSPVMTAFCMFSEYVLAIIRDAEPLDEKLLRRLYSEVTYNMCCDVHNERRDSICTVDQSGACKATEPNRAQHPTAVRSDV